MSRYGWISLSLISCQIMRVISSPSISTTGFATLIFAISESLMNSHGNGVGGRAYSTARITAQSTDKYIAASSFCGDQLGDGGRGRLVPPMREAERHGGSSGPKAPRKST